MVRTARPLSRSRRIVMLVVDHFTAHCVVTVRSHRNTFVYGCTVDGIFTCIALQSQVKREVVESPWQIGILGMLEAMFPLVIFSFCFRNILTFQRIKCDYGIKWDILNWQFLRALDYVQFWYFTKIHNKYILPIKNNVISVIVKYNSSKQTQSYLGSTVIYSLLLWSFILI